jgi:hypothetical protein
MKSNISSKISVVKEHTALIFGTLLATILAYSMTIMFEAVYSSGMLITSNRLFSMSSQMTILFIVSAGRKSNMKHYEFSPDRNHL